MKEGETLAFRKGFSLIELMMVIAVIGILAGIAAPLYENYREKVRVATAILGIGVIAKEIKGYVTINGTYPASLADVGQEAARDPWGNPYQFLRIAGADASGTSDSGKGNAGGSGGNAGGSGSTGGKGGKGSTGSTSTGSGTADSGTGNSTEDTTVLSKARKDHFMVPINTDYDLYSMGADGKTTAPLTAKASQDDIIRANDGLFIGRASEF